MKKVFYVCILLQVILQFNLQAQKYQKDTVWIEGKSVLILADTSLFIDEDTVIVLPDTLSLLLKRDTTRLKSDFYNKLKTLLYQTSVTEELFDLLFQEEESSESQVEASRNNYATYPKHAGKLINDIIIKKLDVFGPEIDDTASVESNSWIINKANDLHSYTRTRIIKNHLFFKEGELLNPTSLEDSERTLRLLPYVKDARVILKPVGENEVNIYVIVKDTWSLTPELEVLDLSRWRVELTERNFLGFGHELRNELYFNNNDQPKFGYRGLYRIRNFQKSFVTADFAFAEADDFMTRGFHIYRNYVTPDIQLAGGLEISLNGRNIIRQLPDTIIDFDVKFQHQDLWLSNATPVGSAEKRKRLITGMRIRRFDYLKQPTVNEDSNYHYFDRDQYLVNVGISKRDYSRSTLIFGFGRTEDIPEGYSLSLTMGKEYNQFENRWYGEFNYAIGGYLGRIGYIRPSISIGSFYDDGNLEQGIVDLHLTYFSNLYYISRFAFRQFFYLNFTKGFNRLGNEFISINDRRGVRGLSSIELQGSKRFVFRAENVSFTPIYLLGFRVALFSFADIGAVTGREKENLFKARFYQGYGIGIRLRNENLAIRSISIRFTFYPNAPSDVIPYDFQMGGNYLYPANDFTVGPPDVHTFRD